jgi:hypothetical protein
MAWYSEKNIKKAMEGRLKKKGFKINGESKHGVDIATYPSKKGYNWFIEVKGYPTGYSETSQRQNYFWHILGQILGRMTLKESYYGICLPAYIDKKKRNFYKEKMLDPKLKNARKWLSLYCFLVAKNNVILQLTPSGKKFKAF